MCLPWQAGLGRPRRRHVQWWQTWRRWLHCIVVVVAGVEVAVQRGRGELQQGWLVWLQAGRGQGHPAVRSLSDSWCAPRHAGKYLGTCPGLEGRCLLNFGFTCDSAGGLQFASGIAARCVWTPSTDNATQLNQVSPEWTSASGGPCHGWSPVSQPVSLRPAGCAGCAAPCFRPWMPSFGIAPMVRVPDVRPLNWSKACAAQHPAGMTPRAPRRVAVP